MHHSESIAAIAEALATAQAMYTTVAKKKTAKVKGFNKKTNSPYDFEYKYADLADILEMALPKLSAQGIAFSQPHILIDGKLRVVTYLMHKSGEWMHSDGIEISEDGDPQQFGAESAYFRRYDGSSFIGVAPDEDTDAQQAGNRTPKVNGDKAQAIKADAQAERNRSNPKPQGQAGQLKFCPPDRLITVIKNYAKIPGKEAADGKKAINPYLKVYFLGTHNGCDSASCFDDKLWPVIEESTGIECEFLISEKYNNGKHFVNITDVLFVDGQEYVDGKPVSGSPEDGQ
jgi:prophage maintenance system killer protein